MVRNLIKVSTVNKRLKVTVLIRKSNGRMRAINFEFTAEYKKNKSENLCQDDCRHLTL